MLSSVLVSKVSFETLKIIKTIRTTFLDLQYYNIAGRRLWHSKFSNLLYAQKSRDIRLGRISQDIQAIETIGSSQTLGT